MDGARLGEGGGLRWDVRQEALSGLDWEGMDKEEAEPDVGPGTGLRQGAPTYSVARARCGGRIY